jgi:hypothetical protein
MNGVEGHLPCRQKTWARLLRAPIIVSFLLASTPVHSADHEVKDRTAKTACLAGEYVKGVTILSELFLETHEVNYIYNQGRCFEQNARYQEAIGRFREYLLREENLSASVKAETEMHIAYCQSFLGQPQVEPIAGTTVPRSNPIATSSAKNPLQTTPRTGTGSQTVVQKRQPPSRAAQAAVLRKAGGFTMLAGGVGLAVGVVLNLKVNSMVGDLEKHYVIRTDDAREKYKKSSIIAYVMGAACVTWGSIFYIFGWQLGQHSPGQVTLAPAVAPGQIGAALEGSF